MINCDWNSWSTSFRTIKKTKKSTNIRDENHQSYITFLNFFQKREDNKAKSKIMSTFCRKGEKTENED